MELPALTRAAALATLALLITATPAVAHTAGSTLERGGDPALTPVAIPFPVPGRTLLPSTVVARARAVPKIARVLRRHPGYLPQPYVRRGGGWQVAFRAGGREVAQVHLTTGGRVTEAWTGIQVTWPMARGYPGDFGRRAASLPVWLMCLGLFALPFARPPWRRLHLDLAVIGSLSISFALFSAGHVRWSVPLAYPPLLYLLARLLGLARSRAAPVSLRLPSARWLAFGIVFLAAFRIGLQIVSSNAIDVGYAGVIGADKLAHLHQLYGTFPPDNPHGDTYGPLTYLAYVPFELVWPWHGIWDDLPAAHAAAAAFDLACAGGLYLVGRARGQGLLLAYLWLACPFTLLVANSGANDGLTGAIVLAAVAARSGALTAAAGLTKLAPLVLLPLLARTRRAVAGALLVTAAALLLILALDGTLAGFWHRAILFQARRDTPFSIWGLYHLHTARLIAQLAVAGLALVAARARADRFALAAALILATQLTAGHWFYLYLDWVLPVAFVALLAPYASGRSTGSIDVARRGPSQRTSTAISHGSSVAVP